MWHKIVNSKEKSEFILFKFSLFLTKCKKNARFYLLLILFFVHTLRFTLPVRYDTRRQVMRIPCKIHILLKPPMKSSLLVTAWSLFTNNHLFILYISIVTVHQCGTTQCGQLLNSHCLPYYCRFHLFPFPALHWFDHLQPIVNSKIQSTKYFS